MEICLHSVPLNLFQKWNTFMSLHANAGRRGASAERDQCASASMCVLFGSSSNMPYVFVLVIVWLILERYITRSGSWFWVGLSACSTNFHVKISKLNPNAPVMCILIFYMQWENCEIQVRMFGYASEYSVRWICAASVSGAEMINMISIKDKCLWKGQAGGLKSFSSLFIP